MTSPSSRPRPVKTKSPLGAALRGLAALSSAALVMLGATEASAQQTTFHLDRLEIPGGPDDGLVLFRPTTLARNSLFAQVGLGYQLNPLHTSNIVTEASTLRASTTGVVQHQFTQYSTVGVHLYDRFIFAANLPIAWVQAGNQPVYSGSILATTKRTSFSTGGPGVGDMRLDMGAVLYRTLDRHFAAGAQFSLFAPTGNGSTANFGGDGQLTAMGMVNAEYTWRFLTLVANTGVHFRATASINDPVNDNGLGIGNEWRFAGGGFVPIKDDRGFDRYRIGGTVFGQTGISNNDIAGNTVFRKRNTPIEWNAEFRMKFGPKDNWWWSAGGGSLLGNGYGAPDLRIVALIGAYTPFVNPDIPAPEQRQLRHEKWRQEHEKVGDADNDGIPDDVDACPNDAEDHRGTDQTDGCPLPPDRDGDGIPDQYDRCPDQPEDKDGIEDGDGCPEDDADHDGVPDVEDACPMVPGSKNTDPKKNGCPTMINVTPTGVFILQQVHFETGSSNILPDSFPMLQEIANYMKVNLHISKMTIEGHTDDRGDAAMNLKLSQGRSEAVRTWLVQHGIDAARLEAHGYGEEKPIESNDTDKGRKANRRVEFKITEQSDPNKTDAPDKPLPRVVPKPAEPPKEEPRDGGEL